ncbi:hypothetical protein BV22DRAFT_266995 [Leucogyrophana mollusca]|uniref:Uncharacterized protein n=1 Tax=Leucogyrophana mollusca TaxID=85980 RepID=A0ACB8BQS1_9AGAM|nr:hypothetical protein BV22DRAFT_266995 [Leucogyrophana mollusca]
MTLVLQVVIGFISGWYFSGAPVAQRSKVQRRRHGLIPCRAIVAHLAPATLLAHGGPSLRLVVWWSLSSDAAPLKLFMRFHFSVANSSIGLRATAALLAPQIMCILPIKLFLTLDGDLSVTPKPDDWETQVSLRKMGVYRTPRCYTEHKYKHAAALW